MKKNILTFLLLFLSSYILAQYVGNIQMHPKNIASLSLQKVVCNDVELQNAILDITDNPKYDKRIYIINLYTTHNKKKQIYYFKIQNLSASHTTLNALYYYWEVNNILFLLPYGLPKNVFVDEARKTIIHFLAEEVINVQNTYDICYVNSTYDLVELYQKKVNDTIKLTFWQSNESGEFIFYVFP